MSDDWLLGSKTGYNRIAESAGRVEGANVKNAVESGRVEKWLVHTDPYGHVTVGLIDKSGRFIVNPGLTSKIFGAGK